MLIKNVKDCRIVIEKLALNLQISYQNAHRASGVHQVND